MSHKDESVGRVNRLNPLTDVEATHLIGHGPWKSAIFLDIASICVIIFLLIESDYSKDLLKRGRYENYISYHTVLRIKREEIKSLQSHVQGFKTLILALNYLEKKETSAGLSQVLTDKLREELNTQLTE